MDKVTLIEGNLVIIDTEVLTDLTGLDSLVSIGGSLAIGGFYSGNQSLVSLTGLEKLTSIGGLLGIGYNPNLTDLLSLNNVTLIEGPLWIFGNDSLTSLTGLENIDANSIDSLLIHDNPLLSICDVKSVCDYIISPNGEIKIHDNANGCNDQIEVETACTSYVDENFNGANISIYPNPVMDNLNLTCKNGAVIERVAIYNQLGEKVFEEKILNNILNVSEINQGLYVIELITDNSKIRKKLIIKR